MQPLTVTHTLTHKSQYPRNPKNGDLLAYHSFEKAGNGQTHHLYQVESPEQAIEVINKLAKEQVNDESIGWNTFGLVVFEEGEWFDWYSEEGDDIAEYENLIATN
jgi:hypothetical protein